MTILPSTIHCAGPMLAETPSPNFYVKESWFLMLAIQILTKTTEPVGAPNIFYPQAVSSPNWSPRDHYVTRIVWNPMAKGCRQVPGSIIKSVCTLEEHVFEGTKNDCATISPAEVGYPWEGSEVWNSLTGWSIELGLARLCRGPQGSGYPQHRERPIVRLQLCLEECESA